MLGTIYFTDGHTEEILGYVKHNAGDIIVESESGVYAFEEYTVESLSENTKRLFKYKTYNFYKLRAAFDDWLVTIDVDHIEIYEE